MKHKQVLSVEALKSMKYPRVYIFYFKSGLEYKVRIESMGATRLTGTTKSVIAKDANGKTLFKLENEQNKAFDFEYYDIIDNSNKVTRLKFNPYVTFVFVGVTVSVYFLSQIRPIPSTWFP